MASYSAEFSVGPKDLTTTTVDTVSLSDVSIEFVAVYNLDGDSNLYITAHKGAAGDLAAPVADANDMRVCPPGLSQVIRLTGSADASPVVKVLGDGNTYLVEGVVV